MEDAPPRLFRLGLRPWHWLVVLLPAAELGLVARYCKPLGQLFFPHEKYASLAVLIDNLFVAAALCWGIGVWLNPHHQWSYRIAGGLGYGLVLAILNVGIAYAGCSFASAI
jgi:hypothetical protein